MIPENQTEVIQYALLQASLEEEVSFYHLTINDITMLAKTINKVMIKNGFRLSITRSTQQGLLTRNQELCETK